MDQIFYSESLLVYQLVPWATAGILGESHVRGLGRPHCGSLNRRQRVCWELVSEKKLRVFDIWGLDMVQRCSNMSCFGEGQILFFLGGLEIYRDHKLQKGKRLKVTTFIGKKMVNRP